MGFAGMEAPCATGAGFNTLFSRLVPIPTPSVAKTESRRSCWLQRAAACSTWRCNSREQYGPLASTISRSEKSRCRFPNNSSGTSTGVALTRSAYSNAIRSRSDRLLDSVTPSAASIFSGDRPALPPTAALMSIQKGQPLRAATRIRTIWTTLRPTAHRPEPKIMLDRNEASIARGACACTLVGFSGRPRTSRNTP